MKAPLSIRRIYRWGDWLQERPFIMILVAVTLNAWAMALLLGLANILTNL